MIVDIEVTQDDIDKGIPKSACDCPIALAVARAAKGCQVSVGNTSVAFSRSYSTLHVLLPEAPRAFINAFDTGALPQALLFPFTFQIDVSDSFLEPKPDLNPEI